MASDIWTLIDVSRTLPDVV